MPCSPRDHPASIEEFARARKPRRPHPGFDELTPRELEVFRLLATGSRTPRSPPARPRRDTIKTHVTRILSKLEVRDRVQAVVLAYEAGLIVPGLN